MSGTLPVWTRREAITKLRARLEKICGPDQSLCRIAADRGIFCHGFRRWHEAEFHRRWAESLGQSTHLSRTQMEALADLWVLTEQTACGARLACDAQAGARGAACLGWDEFDDETLSRFCGEVLGRHVVVRPDAK